MSDKYPWIVDQYDVVHHSYCSLILESATPYGSLAKTNEEMAAHLARPDYRDHHFGPSPLVACDQCILGVGSR